jgi:hypothetical protein
MTSKVQRSPQISRTQATGHGERNESPAAFVRAEEFRAFWGFSFGMGKVYHKHYLQSKSIFACILKVTCKGMGDMTASNTPQLAPPGAGLPFPENRIARILLGIKRWTGNPQSFTAKFVAERQLIHSLISGKSNAVLSKQVLIARPKGLEDSSRYWSVWMTLDHLRIVHHAFIGVLESLANEQVPAGEASTAAVKPDEAVTASVVAEYEASCEALLATIAKITNFKTSAKFPHPWFGPMDAHGWLALSGGHMAIHRTQIERILKGL